MKNRSELFSIYTGIENQFHSDNAREDFSHSFQTLMASHNIFFFKLNVHIHLNKMGFLRTRINTLLKQLTPLYFMA